MYLLNLLNTKIDAFFTLNAIDDNSQLTRYH